LNVVGQVIQRAGMVGGYGNVSKFTARNINASDYYVAALTHSNSSKGEPCSLRCGWLNEVDSERLNNTRTVTEDPCQPSKVDIATRVRHKANKLKQREPWCKARGIRT
jgi:hypothetical protein